MIPGGRWSTLTWHTDGYIYLGHLSGEGNSDRYYPDQIWRVRPGEEFERMEPPGLCPDLSVRGLSSLPDGRLALGRSCRRQEGPVTEVVAWDVATGRTESLVTGAAEVVLTEDTGDGYAANAVDDCAGIAPFTARGGIGGFTDDVRVGQRRWRLDVPVGNLMNDRSCQDSGLSAEPFLTDSGALVFLGSDGVHTEHRGGSGVTSVDGPRWFVCRWDDPDRGELQILGPGFHQPRGAAFWERRESVVLSASRDGEAGLWSVDLTDGAVTGIVDGTFTGPVVSPAGDRLAATHDSGREVRIFDL